jgi:hypothetical protein
VLTEPAKRLQADDVFASTTKAEAWRAPFAGSKQYSECH